MFMRWKKQKAVAGGKAVIVRILLYLQKIPFEPDIPLPRHFWTNPYFVGFFHNIVRYWSRLNFKREPNANEFAEIFTRTIFLSRGSQEDAVEAEATPRENFLLLTTAGEFAAENYGTALARAIRATSATENPEKAMKALTPQLEAAQKVSDFMRGARAGQIYVALVAGDRHGFHDDKVVQDARELSAASGDGEAGVADAYLLITLKAAYKECYRPRLSRELG